MEGSMNVALRPKTGNSPHPATETRAAIEKAVDRFRARMKLANVDFLRDLIADIKDLNMGSDSKELDLIARFWNLAPIRDTHFGTDVRDEEWPREELPIDSSPATGKIETNNRKAKIKKIDDVVEFAFQEKVYMDGTAPPLDQADNEIYLRALTNAVNAEACWPSSVRVELSPEISELLRLTKGVHFPDFAHVGLPHFAVPWPSGNGYSKHEEEQLTQSIREAHCKHQWISPEIYEKFEIAAVWEAGQDMGETDEDTWFIWCFYCRPKTSVPQDDDDDRPESWSEEQGWTWKIDVEALLHQIKGKGTDMGEPKIFDGVVDFLEWYAEWYDRLDVPLSRRKHFINTKKRALSVKYRHPDSMHPARLEA